MPFCLKTVFSAKGNLFASVVENTTLHIWDTSSNSLLQTHCLPSPCTSIAWQVDSKVSTANVAVLYLAVGTADGKVLIYDFKSGELSKEFTVGHTDCINDVCWYSGTDSLFTCSNDKHIIKWDVESGDIHSIWEAGKKAAHTICAIDDNNLLSANSEILWWDVKEKTILKKFKGHGTSILRLLPVISKDDSSYRYFLSAADADTSIKAWNLSTENSAKVVASFNLPEPPKHLDVTESFSKDEPLMLATITVSGSLLLFKHVLNGKTKMNLKPETSFSVVSKCSGKETAQSLVPLISSKFAQSSNSCVVAYGDVENPMFEEVDLVDCPREIVIERKISPPKLKSPQFKKSHNKLKEHVYVNGEVASPSSNHSPKRRKLKEETTLQESIVSQETNELCSEAEFVDDRIQFEHSPKVKTKKKKTGDTTRCSDVCQSTSQDLTELSPEDVSLSDVSNVTQNLLLAVEKDDCALLNTVLSHTTHEMVKDCIGSLPPKVVKRVLQQLEIRLNSQNQRFASSSRRWLKEILIVHSFHLTQPDVLEILNLLQDHINRKRVSETLERLSRLQGLLKCLPTQDTSSKSSDSESACDEEMQD